LPLEQVLAALPDLPLAAPAAKPSTMVAIDTLLRGLQERPCTRLEVEPTSLGLRLVGSTISPTGRTELLAAIGSLEEIDDVSLRLDEAGSFCRLYDMLAVHAESAMPRLADLFPSRADYRLAAAEPLVLRVLTPDFPSHLAVDYFTADGMVVHLEMRQAEAPPLPPVETVWIGDPADGQWLTIAEPYGEELIAVIASREPLFAEPRSRIEPAEIYLDALEAAFAAQASKPKASTIAIETVPARP
jgi:eukaryotic-like serine/threonine-protein kinase